MTQTITLHFLTTLGLPSKSYIYTPIYSFFCQPIYFFYELIKTRLGLESYKDELEKQIL